MRIVGSLTCRLKVWLKDLDIGVSSTWFLLAFVYLSGVSPDGPSVDFSFVGILPVLRVEKLYVAFAIVCLAIAAVAFVEPLLPIWVAEKTKGLRSCALWRLVLGLHLLTAFILGALAGIGFLVENLPTFSWLINTVVYATLVISAVMAFKIGVDARSAPAPAIREGRWIGPISMLRSGIPARPRPQPKTGPNVRRAVDRFLKRRAKWKPTGMTLDEIAPPTGARPRRLKAAVKVPAQPSVIGLAVADPP